MGQNGNGVEACQAGSHQHLCSVGDESLGEAREGVEQRGTFARVELILLSYSLCNASYGDDGYGVVGRTNVDDADQCGNGKLCSAFAVYASRQSLYDEVDTAIVLDDLELPIA